MARKGTLPHGSRFPPEPVDKVKAEERRVAIISLRPSATLFQEGIGVMPHEIETTLAMDTIGDACVTIATLARTHAITVTDHPLDAFAAAASRLCDSDVDSDYYEDLVVALRRQDVISDAERLALHAFYLMQTAGTVESSCCCCATSEAE